jgi:hypothetical protein
MADQYLLYIIIALLINCSLSITDLLLWVFPESLKINESVYSFMLSLPDLRMKDMLSQ